MCNVFKPERCHHCSVCNTCILNMDHHCPWINTCIGYFNRKFFMQMLFYLVVLLYFSIFINFKFFYEVLILLYHNSFRLNIFIESFGVIFIYLLDLVACFILTMFFKFHVTLVLENKSTIETIDKKGEYFESQYDLGYLNNFHQVMGINKLLWFIPIKANSGDPIGNGIDWGIK